MKLTITQMTPEIKTLPGGHGYTVKNRHDGVMAQLQIGNVSVAFDDYNEFRGAVDENYDAVYTELGKLADDPVRLNNQSVLPRPDVAEMLMRALAADLGFSVEKTCDE